MTRPARHALTLAMVLAALVISAVYAIDKHAETECAAAAGRSVPG